MMIMPRKQANPSRISRATPSRTEHSSFRKRENRDSLDFADFVCVEADSLFMACSIVDIILFGYNCVSWSLPLAIHVPCLFPYWGSRYLPINTVFAGLLDLHGLRNGGADRGILLAECGVFRENRPFRVTLVTLLVIFNEYTTRENLSRNEIV